MISLRLLGRKISHTEVSAANGELAGAVEKWRRDLSQEVIKYLFIDGVNFRMRVQKHVEIVPVLGAIGVTEQGHKLVGGAPVRRQGIGVQLAGVFQGFEVSWS